MILPLKADFPLPRFPILTVLVCLICLGVFVKQQSDWADFGQAIERYCSTERSHLETIIFERIGAAENMNECSQIMYTIANDPVRDSSEVIADMARTMRPLTGFNAEDSREYVQLMLEEETRRYKRLVPDDPDSKIAYYTGSWNPITMITSSFAHGDWGHILFNLVFFFAFAATVEVLIGPLRYLAFILADSLFIGVTGSAFAALGDAHYYTLGLSGVVMGMMGLFAYLLPRGKIKIFYFFLVIFGWVAVPGWILVAFFLGGDIVTLLTEDDYGVVNVMAHVMGGLGGFLFGLAFLRNERWEAAHMQDDIDRQDKRRHLR